MTSGAVIRLRPSELVGWIVGDLIPTRGNLIALSKQVGSLLPNRRAQKPGTN